MVHQDDEHALSLISEAVEFASGPVIATVRDGDADFLARAAEHGISAYVQGTEPEAVQGAIEVALRRYRETAALAGKVDQLEGALQRRVVIERAKGILMERHSTDERQAFELLRENARANSRRVVEVAQSVVDGHALLPRDGGAGLAGRGQGTRRKMSPSEDPRPGKRLDLGDFKRAFKRFQADQMTDHAAALTYYSLLSLFPALLFGVASLGYFGRQGADQRGHGLPAAGGRAGVDGRRGHRRAGVGPGPARYRVHGAGDRARDLVVGRVGRLRRGRPGAQHRVARRGGAQLHPQEGVRPDVDADPARPRADDVRADLRRRRRRPGPAGHDRARRRGRHGLADRALAAGAGVRDAGLRDRLLRGAERRGAALPVPHAGRGPRGGGVDRGLGAASSSTSRTSRRTRRPTVRSRAR